MSARARVPFRWVDVDGRAIRELTAPIRFLIPRAEGAAFVQPEPGETGNLFGIRVAVTRNPAGGYAVHIAAGFRWDGASGPTVDTASAERGALVHDALYHLLRVHDRFRNDRRAWARARKVADRVFRGLLIAAGMLRVRRSIWWAAVRLFGRKAARAAHALDAHNQTAAVELMEWRRSIG